MSMNLYQSFKIILFCKDDIQLGGMEENVLITAFLQFVYMNSLVAELLTEKRN
ncbi:MAG: hypothetical protein M3342_04115 [Bacteroidota bacterium]|nr:hypothetical protein [Bacteroidota bacterium]